MWEYNNSSVFIQPGISFPFLILYQCWAVSSINIECDMSLVLLIADLDNFQMDIWHARLGVTTLYLYACPLNLCLSFKAEFANAFSNKHNVQSKCQRKFPASNDDNFFIFVNKITLIRNSLFVIWNRVSSLFDHHPCSLGNVLPWCLWCRKPPAMQPIPALRYCKYNQAQIKIDI